MNCYGYNGTATHNLERKSVYTCNQWLPNLISRSYTDQQIYSGKSSQELNNLLARHGIPEEILTDQGTNFTSALLGEVYQMLGIKAIWPSPYHPQTDSLVEQFNKTWYLERKERHGIKCYHMYFLHIVKYPSLLLDSVLSTYYMAEMLEGYWKYLRDNG